MSKMYYTDYSELCMNCENYKRLFRATKEQPAEYFCTKKLEPFPRYIIINDVEEELWYCNDFERGQ